MSRVRAAGQQVAGRLRLYHRREQVLAALTWVLLRVVPPSPVAVVHGWPDTEGNAVEVVRGLLRRYPGTIYWLRNGRSGTDGLPLPEGTTRVVGLRANSWAAIRVSWRAEAVFFTHGLMTAVRPPASRLVVNLWHGDGPKLSARVPRSRSSVVVAATELWGREKARMFGLPRSDVAVIGNPRVDSGLRSSPEQTRRALGLPGPGVRLVLWLPTFRQGWDGGSVRWQDGGTLSEGLAGALASREDVLMVVKPHPFDTDDYSATGATVVSNADLADAGVTLVQLMAASDAMVSDASSAWVDYLGLDRPLGFFLPDADAYGQARGYNVPDLHAVLPGPVLTTPAALLRFVEDVRTDAAQPPSTFEAAGLIGHVARTPVTDALLDWLDDYQRARRRRPLFTAATSAQPAP